MLPVDFWIPHEDPEQSRGPAVHQRSGWSTSLDLATGVTTKSSAARPRAELGRAPGRVAGKIFAAGRIELAVGDEFAVGPAAGQEQQSALILLEHHGAVRLRDAIVCVRGSESARASAAPRSGPGGINVWIAQRRALHVPRVTLEQRVVSSGGRRSRRDECCPATTVEL